MHALGGSRAGVHLVALAEPPRQLRHGRGRPAARCPNHLVAVMRRDQHVAGLKHPDLCGGERNGVGVLAVVYVVAVVMCVPLLMCALCFNDFYALEGSLLAVRGASPWLHTDGVIHDIRSANGAGQSVWVFAHT